MGKDCLKLTADSPKTMKILLAGGMLITFLLGMKAYEETKLVNGYELQRNDVSDGSYEQEIIADDGKIVLPIRG